MNSVLVEVHSDDPHVRIDMTDGHGSSVPMCNFPCLKYLPRNQRYVVTGSGIPTTSAFMLPDNRNRLSLEVQAGSTGERVVGTVLVVLAVPVLVFSFISFLAVAAFSGLNDSGRSSDGAYALVGLVLLGGLGLGAGGLALRAHGQTHVKSDSGATFSDDSPRRRRKAPRFSLTARGLEF